MIKKFKKYIINDFKMNYKFYIGLICIMFLFIIKFDYYIYTPGSLVDLTNRIKVENSYPSEGTFNLTYVTARPANIPNIVLSYIIPTWDLVSMDDMRIENESEKEIVNRDKIHLKETSYNAIIAAFDEAGIDYSIDSTDVVVTYIYDDADTNIKVGDSIKKINNVSISSFKELKEEVQKYKENERITLEVQRDNKVVECYAVLFKEEDNVLIGVTLSELKNITTNPNVEYIFKDNESGSSRGLLCALDIYNKITPFDLTKGKTIAGTGVIYDDGSVGAIDGVKYKLKGAVKKHADVFIVPSKNYEEAISLKEKYNYDIEIIEADNLHNVILKLNELN